MYADPQKPQRRQPLSAKPLQKPALKPDTIQSAMDRRPRLNANARRAPAAGASAPGAAPSAAPAAPRVPAWKKLADAGMAGQGSAAANRAAAAGLPPAGGAPQIASVPMPPAGGPGPMGQAKPMPRGGPGEMGQLGALDNVNGGGLMGGGMSELPMDAGSAGTPLDGAPPGFPSGSQNPLFSANLPPQIMQRLQALQAGRGGAGVAGGQGAPGGQPPGAPAAVGPALPDYYAIDPYQAMTGGVQPPPQQGLGMQPGGRPPMRPGFDRRMAY